MNHHFHVNNDNIESSIGYDMIIGRDLMVQRGLTVGDCGKVGWENGAMECPDGGTHNGTHDAIILEK